MDDKNQVKRTVAGQRQKLWGVLQVVWQPCEKREDDREAIYRST